MHNKSECVRTDPGNFPAARQCNGEFRGTDSGVESALPSPNLSVSAAKSEKEHEMSSDPATPLAPIWEIGNFG